MTVFHYFYQGLSIRSEFPVPEWEAFAAEDSGSAPDVVISYGKDSSSVDVCARPGEYFFRVEGSGRFMVKRGREILVTPEGPELTRRLRLYLTGLIWGAVLYQRGMLPIHASAVQAGEGVVMFCGRRGQGKSTLAAFLTERGFRMVSDDMCCVNVPILGAPSVHTSLPRFRLRGDSARQLGWETGGLSHDGTFVAKSHYSQPSHAEHRPLPIAGIYLLNWGETRIEPLTGFAALYRFLEAATWRGDVMLSAGNPPDFFRQSAELLRQIPLWVLSQPQDLSAVSATLDVLISHLRSTCEAAVSLHS